MGGFMVTVDYATKSGKLTCEKKSKIPIKVT